MSTIVDRRLTHLGVPAGFHESLMARRAPPFHTLLHLTVILAAIAAAVAAMVVWSRYVAAAAERAASAAHAILYDSDLGAESLGLILTVLLAAGWLCGAITWRHGSESARNGWAADIMHEPAKHKAITDWLWRQMIRRYAKAAINADDFLDQLGRGVVRDLQFAALGMLALTVALGAALPAHMSYATESAITDTQVWPWARGAARPIARATAVISGCPNLPKDGNTLVYRLRFADGVEVNLGAWRPLTGSRLAALETIAARLPSGATRVRFANSIGSVPLSAECLRAFGRMQGADGIVRLLLLLAVSDAEKKGLTGLP
jgi:hypothetical protein